MHCYNKKISKAISWLLCVAMVVSLMPRMNISVKAADPWSYPTSLPSGMFGGGCGSLDDPYLITSAQQLADLSYLVNNGRIGDYCFQLTRDIDLGGTIEWAPIGVYTNKQDTTFGFEGVFDGNGHVIKGLTINKLATYRGLFGYVDGGTIKNLAVEGTIKCGSYSGGIVGKNGGTIDSCSFAGSITGYNNGAGTIGGIAGENHNKIYNCFNTASVSSHADGGNAFGGIAGNSANGSKIENCYNVGNVQAVGAYGGIIGENKGSISGSYYLQGTADKWGAPATPDYANQPVDVTVIMAKQLKKTGTFKNWDFQEIWKMTANGPVPRSFPGDEVTETVVVKKVYATIIEGADGPEPDGNSFEIADNAPAGKQLIAKMVTGGTYEIQDEDFGISFVLNDASVSLVGTEYDSFPMDWEMSGDSEVSFGNMVMTSSAADFPAYEGDLEDIGAIFDFYSQYPYRDVVVDEDTTNWRKLYDCTVTGDYSAKEIDANVLTIEEGATLTLVPFKIYDEEHNVWDDQTSGGMFNGNKLVLNGTIKTEAAQREDNPPVIGLYDYGSFEIGDKGAFDVVHDTELIFGNYSPMQNFMDKYGLYMWAEDADGHETIVPYVYSSKHSRESFFWNAEDKKWICYNPTVANESMVIRYEEFYDNEKNEPKAKVTVNGSLLRSGEEGFFEKGKELKFKLYPSEERKGCWPVVRVESGFGREYMDWATWYTDPSDAAKQINLDENKEEGYFEFSFTPSRKKGLSIDVFWSDYDSFWPGEEAFTLETCDWYTGNGNYGATISVDVESNHMLQEPNGGAGTRRGYENSVVENGGKINVTISVKEGYQLNFIKVENGRERHHYVPGEVTEEWQESMEGSPVIKNADGTYTYVLDYVPFENRIRFEVTCWELPGRVEISTRGIETQYRIGKTGEFQEVVPDQDDRFMLTHEQIIDADQVTIKYLPEENQEIYGYEIRYGDDPNDYDRYRFGEDYTVTIDKGEGWLDYRVEPVNWNGCMNEEFMVNPRDMENLTINNGEIKAQTIYGFKVGQPITINFGEEVLHVLVYINGADTQEITPVNGSFTYTPQSPHGIQFDVFTTEEKYELEKFQPNHDAGELSAGYFVHVNDWVEGVGGTVTPDIAPLRSKSAGNETKVIYKCAEEGEKLLVTMTITPDVGSTYIFREENIDITEQVIGNENKYVWDLTEPWNIKHFEVDFQPKEFTITVNGGTANCDKTHMKRHVDLAANIPDGKEFDKWVVVSGGITIDDETAPQTGFTMGTEDVVVQATWKENPVLFDLYGANMNLGNALDMNFFIENSKLEAGKEYYVVITKAYADKAEVSTVRVEQSKWQKYNSSLWFVTLKGVSAKEMNDKVTVQVFYSDGTAASTLWEDSVVNYVKRAIKATSADKYTKDLMVDMLHYGAAAQVNFGYDTGNLADAWLEEAGYAGYGQTAATAENKREMGANCKGSNLNLGSSLCLNVFFENVTNDMYAIVTYKDHNNKDVSYRVNYGKFVTMSGLYGVPVNTLSAADADTLVSITMYNGDGTVYGSAQDSIASYLARMKLTNGSIYTAIKKFCDSANAYFHRQD